MSMVVFEFEFIYLFIFGNMLAVLKFDFTFHR